MQKSGFPKMCHYVGFWKIGSHITDIITDTDTILVGITLFSTDTTNTNSINTGVYLLCIYTVGSIIGSMDKCPDYWIHNK